MVEGALLLLIKQLKIPFHVPYSAVNPLKRQSVSFKNAWVYRQRPNCHSIAIRNADILLPLFHFPVKLRRFPGYQRFSRADGGRIHDGVSKSAQAQQKDAQRRVAG